MSTPLYREHDGTRPVLSRTETVGLAEKILSLVGKRNLGVQITHTAQAVTKVARGRVLRTDSGSVVRIVLRTEVRPTCDISLRTNRLSEESLKRVLERAAVLAPVIPEGEGLASADYSVQNPFLYQPKEFLPVSLWYPSTAAAMETAQAETAPILVDKFSKSSLSGAATINVTARTTCLMYHYGLTAFADETDTELTVTARTKDGSTSGWEGQAHRDWRQITPSAVAERAMTMAERGKNAVVLEPGRRTVILGSTAVGQLVRQMMPHFPLDSTLRGQTPFSTGNIGENVRRTKRGERVMDPRIMMVSDPADPMGGFPPFTEEGGKEYAYLGFPVQPVTWIDRGVLKMMVTGALGDPPCDLPRSVRLSPAPGTATATIDEMIANCAEGIYVNRFSNVFLLDRKTGMMTGATRDGCFLVKNGKISKPVKNFRFLEAPVFAFNRVEMIGEAQRVAISQEPPTEFDRGRWPYFPIIAPPMMIRDFNFSGLTDAV